MKLIFSPWLRRAILGVCLGACPIVVMAQRGQPAQPQGPQTPQPWFGQTLPPPVDDPTASISPDGPQLPVVPATFGPGPKSPFLDGDKIWADTKTVVDFSLKSKAQGDFRWGRIVGTQAHHDTVDWAVQQMKAAGLKDAHLEEFPVTVTNPDSAEVRILADPSYGPGSQDIVLKTGNLSSVGGVNGTVTGPMIYVGHGTDADMVGRDVKGKIAVLHITPSPGMLAADEFRRSTALLRAGAVGVIEVLELPGNMQAYSPLDGCGNGMCFNVGGKDGFFLEGVLGKAGIAGKAVSAKLTVSSPTRNLTGVNGVATIPGKTNRTIIFNLHADAWYMGADDNATGVAVGVALARYFANRKPDHTLVFMVSAGHHDPSPSGIQAFRKAHDNDYVKDADLVINLEHEAGAGMVRGFAQGQRDNFGHKYVFTTTDWPMEVSVSNLAPYLIDLYRKGSSCFGLSFERTVDDNDPGEPSSGYRNIQKTVPVVQMESFSPLYHTSNENMASIPAPALERAARFYAFFVDAADKAAPELLKGGPYTSPTGCPATP